MRATHTVSHVEVEVLIIIERFIDSENDGRFYASS